jgi:hypothetical protein
VVDPPADDSKGHRKNCDIRDNGDQRWIVCTQTLIAQPNSDCYSSNNAERIKVEGQWTNLKR